MDWFWTWQDPAALTLAAALLAVAFVLGRGRPKAHDCARCPALRLAAPRPTTRRRRAGLARAPDPLAP
jgi:hypothetical protein